MCWATQRRLQTVVSSSQSHTAIPGSFPRLFCKKFASCLSSRNLSRFVTTRGTCFLCGLLPRFRSCSRPFPFFFPLCHLEPFFNTCSPKLTRQNVPVIQCSRYGCGDPYTLLKKKHRNVLILRLAARHWFATYKSHYPFIWRPTLISPFLR